MQEFLVNLLIVTKIRSSQFELGEAHADSRYNHIPTDKGCIPKFVLEVLGVVFDLFFYSRLILSVYIVKGEEWNNVGFDDILVS